MNDDAVKQAAYVQAMTTCALLEGLGKLLDQYVHHTTNTLSNQHEREMREVIDRYGIHHNAVMGALYNR